MFLTKRKIATLCAILASSVLLSACSSSEKSTRNAPFSKSAQTQYKGSLANQSAAISRLSAQQREWKGTRYRLGGTSKSGVDCSAFTQITFRDLFGIDLPRTTNDQARKGVKVSKSELKTGDLVFFKTGRGPNGKHVGIYMDNGRFLHASTKGGVIYSDLNSPYWSKTYWQARRL